MSSAPAELLGKPKLNLLISKLIISHYFVDNVAPMFSFLVFFSFLKSSFSVLKTVNTN